MHDRLGCPASPANNRPFNHPSERGMLANVKRFGPYLLAALAIIGLPLIAPVGFQGSLIYHPHREEVAPNFAATEAIRLETGDGERIVAWYHPPQPGQPIFLFFDGNGG